MKFFSNLFITALLVLIGYFLYPSLTEHFGWGGEEDAQSPSIADDTSAPDLTDTSSSTENRAKPAPTPTPTPTPRVTEQPTPTNSVDQQLEKRFPYPEIKSLAEITQDWKAVPERALPKTLTLSNDLKFSLGGGENSVTKAAGSVVYPASTTADGMVVVTMAPGSSTTSQIPIDDTDLKEQVQAMYDKGVAGIHEQIDARRKEERARLANAATITEEEKASAGIAQTATASDDYLGLMKESVSNGELDGISSSDIIDWYPLGSEKVGGTVYFTGAAVYNVKTLFGEFQTEAKALIRNGKVERWERSDQ